MPIDFEETVDITDVNDEIWFDIINRTITPKDDTKMQDILVQNDANSRNLCFMIQRYFEDEDLSTKNIKVHFVNSLNQHDYSNVHSLEIRGDTDEVLSFKWLISNNVCVETGNVKFAIEFYDSDTGYELFTKPTMIKVEEGIYTVGEIDPSEDWYKHFRDDLDKLEKDLDNLEESLTDNKCVVENIQNSLKENEYLPTVEYLEDRYEFNYYSSLEYAILDINSGKTEYIVSKSEAKVATFLNDDGYYSLILLDDVTESSANTVNKDIKINLNNKTLTMTTDSTACFIFNGNTTIDGRLGGKVISTGVNTSSQVNLFVTKGEYFTINGGYYEMNGLGNALSRLINQTSAVTSGKVEIVNAEFKVIAQTGTARVINLSGTNDSLIDNCKIICESINGNALWGVANYGNMTFRNSIITTDLNRTTAGSILNCGVMNYGTLLLENNTVFCDAPNNSVEYCYAKAIVNNGTATINSGTYIGTHSSVSNVGTLYINGGKFTSCAHGGLYTSGNQEVFINNAILGCETYIGKYNYSAMENEYLGAFYIGGSADAKCSNNNVYIDSSTLLIANTENAGVLRGTDGEHDNTLYVSNTDIPDGSTMRIDDNNYVIAGINTNITSDNVTNSSLLSTSNDEYIYNNKGAFHKADKTYVDDQDTATLNLAKKYADTKADKSQLNKINMHDVVIPIGLPENDDVHKILTFPNFIYNGVYYYLNYDKNFVYSETELNKFIYIFVNLEPISEQYGNANLQFTLYPDTIIGDFIPYGQFKVTKDGVSYIFYCNNVFTFGLGDKFNTKADKTDLTNLTNKAYSLGVAGLYNENNELIKSWEKLIADGDITESGTTITGNNLTNSGKLIIDSSVTSIGDDSFYGCESLTSVTIPDSVTSIGSSAFTDCLSLTSVTVSNNIINIDAFVFAGCTSLTNITIPDGITSINLSAFESCTSLISVAMPDSVTIIDDGAFNNCTSLTDVYFKGTKTQWNSITIVTGNDALTNATIHYELTDEVYDNIATTENRLSAIESGEVNEIIFTDTFTSAGYNFNNISAKTDKFIINSENTVEEAGLEVYYLDGTSQTLMYNGGELPVQFDKSKGISYVAITSGYESLGTVTIQYIVDTKTYIDNAIASAIGDIIGGAS